MIEEKKNTVANAAEQQQAASSGSGKISAAQKLFNQNIRERLDDSEREIERL